MRSEERSNSMPTETNETTILLLRDADGTTYALTEEAIRACRATPEQQAALHHLIREEDVRGYAATGGFAPVGAITVAPQIAVAPQINTNVGLNIAAANFAPVNQVLGQSGVNAFSGFNFR
jgi:hypothetical protein